MKWLERMSTKEGVAIEHEAYPGPHAPEFVAGSGGVEMMLSMDRFLARGPMRTDDGTKVIGTTYIIQVKDRAAAEAFIAEEPMTKAGVFSKIRIDRWRFGKSILGG